MSTVDDAIEAGARALAEAWTDENEYGSRQDMSRVAARAQWPILSEGLRELVGWLNDDQDSVALEEVLDRIDKELGL